MAASDPRALLERLIAERGDSYAALSRLLGRNVTYLQQFVTKGSPRALAERDRRLLARYFGVPDSALGGPEEAELAAVVRLDVAAAAGPGALADEDRALRLARMDRALLRALGVRPQAASLIRVSGDSMLPTLADGDEILVNGDDRVATARPGLFVLRLDGALLVKRLAVADGVATVISDNPAWPPLAVDAAQVEPIGRVAWLGRAIRDG